MTTKSGRNSSTASSTRRHGNGVVSVRELTGGKPIHAVLGGMHLLWASQDRLSRTIQALRRLNVEYLGPAHCTGMSASAQMWVTFPGRCFSCHVGTTITFDVPFDPAESQSNQDQVNRQDRVLP